ncbi:MAG TPA: ankyrin repeat domain-containing protein [Planctomycetes bacterium]|nr:ankyrin repeat domain-containing protein [Planctomycetota bacterium]
MTRRKLKLYLVALFLVLGLWIVMLGFVPYYIDQMEEMETVGLASIDRAIIAGDLAAVTYWLEKGVDANSSCGYMLGILINGSTPLMVALNSSYSYSPSPPSPPSPEIVSRLIENGADVNTIDSFVDKTPLMHALSNPRPGSHSLEIVSLLLVAGAEVNASNNNGWTPLMYALKESRPGSHSLEVVSLLLETGAEVNASNNNGSTPLMYASKSCCPKPEIIMLLLDEGADPLAIDKHGNMAFDYIRFNDELQGTEAYKKLQDSSFK